jgi:hypothetical protein
MEINLLAANRHLRLVCGYFASLRIALLIVSISLLSIFQSSIFSEPVLTFNPGFGDSASGFHQHDGFFLSISTGPTYGPIALDISGAKPGKITFSGIGYSINFRIGCAVIENTLVSIDVLNRWITSPLVTSGDLDVSSSAMSAGDGCYGIGLTQYFMPSNLFLCATLGEGTFNFAYNSARGASESGLAFIIKAGKEWWISKNWAIGIATGYGYLRANDKPDPLDSSYSAKLSSDKIFVLFNTSFN